MPLILRRCALIAIVTLLAFSTAHKSLVTRSKNPLPPSLVEFYKAR